MNFLEHIAFFLLWLSLRIFMLNALSDKSTAGFCLSWVYFPSQFLSLTSLTQNSFWEACFVLWRTETGYQYTRKIIFWKQWLFVILKFNIHRDYAVFLLCTMPSWKYLESLKIHALFSYICINAVSWEGNRHLSGLYLTLVSSMISQQSLEVITSELNRNWFGIM